MSSAAAKKRAIDALVADGHRAGSGPVRLAFPFSLLVEGVADGDVPAVRGLVTHADPVAGRIVTTRA